MYLCQAMGDHQPFLAHNFLQAEIVCNLLNRNLPSAGCRLSEPWQYFRSGIPGHRSVSRPIDLVRRREILSAWKCRPWLTLQT